MTTKRFLAMLALVLFLPAAACNTVEGMGQDTQAAGNAIEDSAEDASN